MKRRKNGEGTWGKKNIKNVEYVFYRNADGKYFYGRTDKEVKQKIKKDEENKKTIDNHELFYDYVFKHLQTRISNLESTTFDGYEDAINSMLKNNTVGNLTMDIINEDILRRYIIELSKKYSRASIEKLYKVVNPALNYAVEHKHIKENYLKYVKIPSESNVAVKAKKVPFITESDLIKLYNESKRINTKGFNWGGKIGQPTYGSNAQAVVLIGYTGLRISELRGLKWEDVDIKNKTIEIKNAIVRVKNRDDGNLTTKYIMKEKKPKTESSHRIIPLSDVAIEMINFFGNMFPNHKPNDLVVRNINGNSPSSSNVQKTLDAMLVRSGCSIQHCGLHGLRHGFGSILLTNGVDIKIVSKLLGHKKISTTYDIYIDFTQEQVNNEIMSVLNK